MSGLPSRRASAELSRHLGVDVSPERLLVALLAATELTLPAALLAARRQRRRRIARSDVDEIQKRLMPERRSTATPEIVSYRFFRSLLPSHVQVCYSAQRPLRRLVETLGAAWLEEKERLCPAS